MSRPALRHGSLDSLFQVALYPPSYRLVSPRITQMRFTAETKFDLIWGVFGHGSEPGCPRQAIREHFERNVSRLNVFRGANYKL